MDNPANQSTRTTRPTAEPDPLNGPVGVDPVDFVRRHSRLLAGGLLLGAAIGLGITFFVTPRWQADLVLRIGTMPEWSKDAFSTAPVESPARAVERINQASFKDTVLARLGLSANDGDTNARIFRKSLRARLLDKPDLVAVRVEGPSRQDAQRYALAIADELAKTHAHIANPTRERFERFLATTQDDLRRTEDARTRLLESIVSFSKARDNTAGVSVKPLPRVDAAARDIQGAFGANVLAAQNSALRELQERAFVIREILSPQQSYPTAPIEPVKVDEIRSYPRRPIFTLTGAGLGLTLAAIAAAFRRESDN